MSCAVFTSLAEEPPHCSLHGVTPSKSTKCSVSISALCQVSTTIFESTRCLVGCLVIICNKRNGPYLCTLLSAVVLLLSTAFFVPLDLHLTAMKNCEKRAVCLTLLHFALHTPLPNDQAKSKAGMQNCWCVTCVDT